MDLTQSVINTINEYDMFKKGDKVIVAVSGGPDSMCLLHVLNKLKEQFDIDICAAHVNHCLRGKAADDDEKYVKNFCVKNNLEFYSIKIDVNKLAADNNTSCETAGREARYNYFNKVKNEIHAQKIALAHNSNDKAETIIMRLIRGTGLDGLEGIKPVRDGIYVRPLIGVSRDRIEKYCIENNIEPRIDKTNLEKFYTRNKIRLDLIPYIQNNFNKDFINTINRFSEIVKKDNDYLEKVCDERYAVFCCAEKDKIIIDAGLFDEHEAVITRVIRKCLLNIKGTLYNIDKKNIYDIIELQKSNTGKKLILSDGILICNSYNNIYIYAKNYFNKCSRNQIKLDINSQNMIYYNGMTIKFEVIKQSDDVNLKVNKYVKYFNMDKIKHDIVLRYRKNGDKFNPLGMKNYKKLKDIFIDLKVPKEERDIVPLICFNDEIAWIVGYKISDKFKVSKDTKEILKIKIESEEKR